MNHGWPNLGHDSLIHALLDTACELLPVAEDTGIRIRALSFDVRRTGLIPEHKIARAAQVARKYARDAAKLGAARIEVLVTAPARQGKNGSELVDAITDATRLPVRPLSAEEEGRLAFAGVVSTFPAVKTKNGVSIARTAPDAPDGDAASFVESPNGASTPGAANFP